MVAPGSDSDRFDELRNRIADLQKNINLPSARSANLEGAVAEHGGKPEHLEDQLERLGGRPDTFVTRLPSRVAG